jgi:hypothetical protein
MDALAANGVNSAFVTASTTNNNTFIVKDWATNGPPSFTNPYPYKLTLVRESDGSLGMVPAPPGRSYGDLSKLATLPGQNTAPPSEEWFFYHYIVKYGQTYYDPSYATNYSSAIDFETKAIYGYAFPYQGLIYRAAPAVGLHYIQFDQ